MYDNRYPQDDIIPMLADDGVATTLAPLIAKNHSEEYLIETITTDHGIILLTGQLRQLIADLAAGGFLPGVDTSGLPEAISRAAAPSGIGCGNGNIWVSPIGDAYVLRFYVNSEYKLTLTNYYLTDLATLGATSGDVVQVCQVVDGVPGWWSRIVVP